MTVAPQTPEAPAGDGKGAGASGPPTPQQNGGAPCATTPGPDRHNAAALTIPLTITVYGQPAPQGSKRAFRNSKTGRIQQVESSAAVKPWREAVKHAALVAMDTGLSIDEWGGTFVGPLAVSMTFTVRKPAAAPKRKRTWPDRQPDLSKLARSTEDALTDAGVWVDDARVVRYDRLAKVFPGEGDDALATPGAVIRVWQVTP